MIITSLLDKPVMLLQNESLGIISAVYQHGDNLNFVVADNDGNLHSCNLSQIRLCSKPEFAVVMLYNVVTRIHAIKTVRDITGEGLAFAKEMVESNPGRLTLKSHISMTEALDIKNRIECGPLSCLIVPVDNGGKYA